METYQKPVLSSAVEINGALPAVLAAASAVGFATALAGDFTPHPERKAKLSEHNKKD